MNPIDISVIREITERHFSGHLPKKNIDAFLEEVQGSLLPDKEFLITYELANQPNHILSKTVCGNNEIKAAKRLLSMFPPNGINILNVLPVE